MAFTKNSPWGLDSSGSAICVGRGVRGGDMEYWAGRRAICARDAAGFGIEQTLAAMKSVGCTHVDFHDTEAEPADAKKIMAAVPGAPDSRFSMCTADLFKRRPGFRQRQFRLTGGGTRAKSVRRTKEHIRTGIEVFDAKVYVYWNSSNGYGGPMQVNYRDLFRQTADGLSEVVEWMLGEYGPERALPIAIEPKPRRAGRLGRACGLRRDARHHRPDGCEVPPVHRHESETCHALMAGKRYAAELGLAAAADKVFYVHLNGGTGPEVR